MTARGAAREPSKKPLYFSHYTEVDIDIDAADLERAGWRYVGKDDEEPEVPEQTAIDIVRLWHDDTHEGPWQWCAEQPCDAVRGRWTGLNA